MNNLDRRDFLRAAGVATLDSALNKGVRGANDRIAIGFIGIGVMGTENLRAAMAQPGVAVSAVCDVYQPHLERAAAMARRAGHQPKETADFRQVIADPSIDAVCISTPDHWHPYMTVQACKAGKDVYVEKPACVVIGEGRAMVAAARKYKRIVQAGTWQRSGAHFQRACELVRNGTLGKVTVARTWIYSNQPEAGIGNPSDGPVPSGLDWNMWLGPAPARPFNPNRFGVYPDAYSYFRYFWDYAGGQLTDSGVHMIDIVQMAFGDPMPLSVAALGGKYWFKDDTETPDTLQVTFSYPGFLGSWEHRSNNTFEHTSRLMGATFHGTRGTLYVDRELYRIVPEKGSDLEASEMKRVADPHPLHWVNFLSCVRSRQTPNSEIETCYRSSAACILGNLSLRARTRIDWDDENGTTQQAEARPFLSREYRSPWSLTF